MEKDDNINTDLKCKAVLRELFPDIIETPTVIDDDDDPQLYYVITYPNNHPFREKLRIHSDMIKNPMTDTTTGQVKYPPTIKIPELPYEEFLSVHGVTYGGKYKRKNRESRKGRKSRKSKRRSKRSV